MTSAVLIAPASLVPAVDAATTALGWGPGNLSIPLAPDGIAPATHHACRADVKPDELAALEAVEGLTVHASADLWGADHLAAALAENGLAVVENGV